MPSLDQCIIDKCKESWEEEFFKGTQNKNNCSGFVKSVAKKLGVTLPEYVNADGIMDEISKSWTKVATGKDAADRAFAGALVIAGLKAADHSPPRNNGHVVIVVSGALYRKTYPLCWCGSIGSAQSQGTKSIGEVWGPKDRDSVAYYEYGQMICPAQ